jgi:LPS sulfotransferase NodH
VFVSRSDKVRQAVSLWRALQTLVWRKDNDLGAVEQPPEQRSVYSFDAIDHLLDQLRRHEDAWRGFFFSIGQRPLSLYYEDIAGDLEGTVGRVLQELRIGPTAGPLLARESLSRQSDELSESWVQSYLEDVSRR